MNVLEVLKCHSVVALLLVSGLSFAATEGFNPNYLLLGADSIDSPGDTQTECDVKFQISFTSLLSTDAVRSTSMVDKVVNFTGPLYFGYTQRSFWDICRESAPFRATNYQPEIFFKNTFMAKNIRAETYTGYRHESNGRDGDESRGWDRVYTRLRFPIGDSRRFFVPSTDTTEWVLDAQLWYPFSVSENNSDIKEYAGYGELGVTYTPNSKNRFRLTLRKGGGFDDWDRGLANLDWIFELPRTNIEMIAQFTNGYADSLDRYDQHEYALRIGFIFSDFNPPEVACESCE